MLYWQALLTLQFEKFWWISRGLQWTVSKGSACLPRRFTTDIRKNQSDDQFEHLTVNFI
jgi:hypothetical protein